VVVFSLKGRFKRREKEWNFLLVMRPRTQQKKERISRNARIRIERRGEMLSNLIPLKERK